MMGCLRRTIGLLLLLVILLAAWVFRGTIRDRWREVRGLREDPLVATEALSDRAQARMDSLEAGQTDRIALSEVELQSLLGWC